MLVVWIGSILCFIAALAVIFRSRPHGSWHQEWRRLPCVCGYPRDGLPAGKPCPECGEFGLRRVPFDTSTALNRMITILPPFVFIGGWFARGMEDPIGFLAGAVGIGVCAAINYAVAEQMRQHERLGIAWAAAVGPSIVLLGAVVSEFFWGVTSDDMIGFAKILVAIIGGMACGWAYVLLAALSMTIGDGRSDAPPRG